MSDRGYFPFYRYTLRHSRNGDREVGEDKFKQIERRGTNNKEEIIQANQSFNREGWFYNSCLQLAE